jgi:hypothetical protein
LSLRATDHAILTLDAFIEDGTFIPLPEMAVEASIHHMHHQGNAT